MSSTVRTTRPRRGWLLIMALCCGLGLAHLGTSTMPFQIGALIDGAHRSPAQAGLFGFFQVGALALAMIVISPWIDRLAPRNASLGGCALATLASTGLFFVPSFALQMMCGALVGCLGCALGMGCGFPSLFKELDARKSILTLTPRIPVHP